MQDDVRQSSDQEGGMCEDCVMHPIEERMGKEAMGRLKPKDLMDCTHM